MRSSPTASAAAAVTVAQVADCSPRSAAMAARAAGGKPSSSTTPRTCLPRGIIPTEYWPKASAVVAARAATRSMSESLSAWALVGPGGNGGDGSIVEVNTDVSETSVGRSISTQGDHSGGIVAHSVGGSGRQGRLDGIRQRRNGCRCQHRGWRQRRQWWFRSRGDGSQQGYDRHSRQIQRWDHGPKLRRRRRNGRVCRLRGGIGSHQHLGRCWQAAAAAAMQVVFR